MDEVLQGIKQEVHYLDNILIHTSETEEEYQVSVEQVLERLMDHDVAVNLSKLEFHVKEIVFLGYVINSLKVKMDGAKNQDYWRMGGSTKEEWTAGIPQFRQLLSTLHLQL